MGSGAWLESDLHFVMGQLAQLPTRGYLAKAALGIIFCTAALVILWAEAFGIQVISAE
jgi:hypothetical protein